MLVYLDPILWSTFPNYAYSDIVIVIRVIDFETQQTFQATTRSAVELFTRTTFCKTRPVAGFKNLPKTYSWHRPNAGMKGCGPISPPTHLPNRPSGIFSVFYMANPTLLQNICFLQLKLTMNMPYNSRTARTNIGVSFGCAVEFSDFRNIETFDELFPYLRPQSVAEDNP